MKNLRRALLAITLLVGVLALVSSDAANILYTFTQGPFQLTGTAPDGVAVGDLNGDGVLDVVTADAGSNSISVMLGNPDGTFQPRSVRTVGQNPSAVALADLDGDGNLDLIVTNNDDNTVMILWGDGKGGFEAAPTILPTQSGPHRIAVADIDGDGKLDFAVVDWTGTGADIFFNDGNRHFTDKFLGSWGSADSIALGSLTKDGMVDIVIAGEKELVYLNQGGRNFAQLGPYSPGFSADSVVIKDINGDGFGDVISASQHNAVMNILYNTGEFPSGNVNNIKGKQQQILDDNVNDIITYQLAGGATDLEFADVNGDGIDDAIVSYGTTGAISVLIGTPGGHFLAHEDSTIATGVDHIVPFKLNGKGNVDLIGSSSAASQIMLFYGNPGIVLSAAVSYPVGTSPTGIAVGDLTNNGFPDLVTANTVDGTISVLLGSINGNYGSRTDISVGLNAEPRRVGLADFNDDGNLDAATVNSGTGNVTVLLGTGTGIFGNIHSYTYTNASAPTDLAIANLNGAKDTKGNPIQDIAVVDPSAGEVATLIGAGDGTFTAGTTLALTGTPYAIAAGDFENNGNEDLAVTEYTAGDVAILHNDGAGNLSVLAQYAVGTNPDAIVVGDFNGDGIPDIAVANFGSGTVSILLNNGTGTFTLSQTVTIVGKGSTSSTQTTSVQPVAITSADMNGDGSLDLITTNNEGSISVIFGEPDGGFGGQTNLVDPSGPSETVAQDLNGDGRADLATADKNTSTVSIRLTNATNAPVASDVNATLDTQQSSFLLGTMSATSPAGTSLTFKILTKPAFGTVVLTDPVSGSFTYTPTQFFTGTDVFTYEALNGTVASNQASVTIVVSNSGPGAFNWLLVVLLAGFVGWRKFIPGARPAA